jgi:hypothetical protein
MPAGSLALTKPNQTPLLLSRTKCIHHVRPQRYWSKNAIVLISILWRGGVSAGVVGS